jgi:hypothetical protein
VQYNFLLPFESSASKQHWYPLTFAWDRVKQSVFCGLNTVQGPHSLHKTYTFPKVPVNESILLSLYTKCQRKQKIERETRMFRNFCSITECFYCPPLGAIARRRSNFVISIKWYTLQQLVQWDGRIQSWTLALGIMTLFMCSVYCRVILFRSNRIVDARLGRLLCILMGIAFFVSNFLKVLFMSKQKYYLSMIFFCVGIIYRFCVGVYIATFRIYKESAWLP